MKKTIEEAMTVKYKRKNGSGKTTWKMESVHTVEKNGGKKKTPSGSGAKQFAGCHLT